MIKRFIATFLLIITLVPYTAVGVFGLAQSADLESGSSQYFSRADTASLSITGDLTLECWINIESDTGAEQYIFNKQDSGTTRSWYFRINTGGELFGNVDQANNGTDRSQATGSTDIVASYLGQWVHVGMQFNASNGEIDFTVNGVDDSATNNDTSATAINDSDAASLVGAAAGPGGLFDGKLSLCRVWSERRTTSEINDNKCNVLGSTTNLAAEWTLDNTVNDNSGNSNTLTNNNSTPFVSDVPADCADVSTGGGNSQVI